MAAYQPPGRVAGVDRLRVGRVGAACLGVVAGGGGILFLLSRLHVVRALDHLWQLSQRGDIAWFIPLYVGRLLKRDAKQIFFFLLGATVISAGVLGYYRSFNRMIGNLDDRSLGLPSAVSWVEPYNTGRTGPELVLFAATAPV